MGICFVGDGVLLCAQLMARCGQSGTCFLGERGGERGVVLMECRCYGVVAQKTVVATVGPLFLTWRSGCGKFCVTVELLFSSNHQTWLASAYECIAVRYCDN